MSKSKVLTGLKEVYFCLRDNNNNKRTLPIGRLGKMELSRERLGLLNDIIDLCIDTNIFCNETKLYLSDRYITFKGVAEALYPELEEKEFKSKCNTIASKIGYDRDKIERLFGENVLTDVFYGNPIDKYKEIVIREIYKRSGDIDALKDIVIDLPKNCICSRLDDDGFDSLQEFLMPYYRYQKDARLKALLDSYPDSIGYLVYLFSYNGLSEEDKKRKDLIVSRMTGKYEDTESLEDTKENEDTQQNLNDELEVD